MKVKRIITHPGHAHRDEFLAVALALALAEGSPPDVVRTDDISEEDFNDPEVLILDVGGRHEPQLGNFDHHQMPKSADAVCAFTLLLKAEGLYDDAVMALPWVRPLEILDSKGPMSLSKQLEFAQCPDMAAIIGDTLTESGINLPSTELPKEIAKRIRKASSTWEKIIIPMMSPIDSQVLHDFQQLGVIIPEYSIYMLLQDLGNGLLESIHGFKRELAILNEDGLVLDLKGHKILKVPDSWRSNTPTSGAAIYEWRRSVAPDAIASISPDARCDGYSLFRFDDNPHLDFSALAEEPDIVFAHVNGFIAKTRERDPIRALELIDKALTTP